MSDDEEIYIKYILPISPTEDELHSWGMIKFRTMTKEEFQKLYPSNYYGKFARKIDK